MSPIIETSKAIIKDNVQILKHIKKYTLPQTILDPNSTVNHDTFIKMAYRRFIRLKPLVSKREMVRDTYTQYIRCKYTYEPLGVKRSLICGDEPNILHKELRQQIYNSLQFILQAVTYGEDIPTKCIQKDVILAKQILKNLLTVEYEKLKDDSVKMWHYRKNQMVNSDLIDFNIEFNHLKSYSKLPRDKETKYVAIRSFDECLAYLNKTLNTIL